MAALTGQTIASSYEQLLHVDRDGGGNTSTLVNIKDGDNGTTFCISMTDASTGKAVLAVDGSHASGTEVQIDNSATDGDAFLSFQLSGTSKFTMGVDDGDSDKFKIGTTAIGTGTMFALDTNSRISLSNNDSGGTGGLDSTSGNTTLGYLSGNAIASGGHDNTFYGHGAGKSLTTGEDNCAFGAGALAGSQDGDGNTAIGFESLAIYEGSDTQGKNTALGFKSSRALTTGQSNTSAGYNSAALMTTGDGNVAIGALSLGAAVSAESFNVALGYNSMGSADEGSIGNIDNNIAIGYEALKLKADVDANLYNNIAIGYHALSDANYVGSGMVAIGKNSCKELEDGDSNTAVGKDTLKALTSGDNNTAFGTGAGDVLQTGSNNTCIGQGADVDAQDRAGCIVIGAGLSLNTANDNVVEIGNDTNSMTYDLDGGDITVTSDVRTKKNIKNTKLGLEFIKKLRPITYQTKPSSQYPKEFGIKNTSKKSSGKTWDGLIAQEVKEVMDEMGIEFSGWEEGINTKQRLAYGKFVMPLIKAVQELSAKVEALEAK